MNNSELQHLKKDELIHKIQQLEKKSKRLEKEIKNLKEESYDFQEESDNTLNKMQKELALLQSMYNKWSVENIIPINKSNYSEDEKKTNSCLE